LCSPSRSALAFGGKKKKKKRKRGVAEKKRDHPTRAVGLSANTRGKREVPMRRKKGKNKPKEKKKKRKAAKASSYARPRRLRGNAPRG